jgi:hypothetical protein
MAITPTDWSRRVQITEINTSPALSGYVALLTESNLPAEIWTTAINGGGDLRVCLNSDGTSQLPLEVVNFDTVEETGVLWVRFPTFTSGDSLWLFYGKAGETQPTVTDTFGRNSVWSDFNAVYHLNDPTDSTGSFDATNVGASLQSGGGYEFTGTGRLEIPNAVGEGLANNHTIDFSFLNNGTLVDGHFLDTRQGSGTGIDLEFRPSNAGLGAEYSSSASGAVVLNPSAFPSGSQVYRSWFVYDGASVNIFVDSESAIPTAFTGLSTRSASPVKIGNQVNNGEPLGSGRVLLSMKIRDYAISTDLKSTEYENQSSPNTFWSTGTPEDTGGGGGGLVITSIAIASAESFGTPVLTAGAVTLSPETIASAEALGNPTISQGATFISPLSINTEEFVGNPVVTPQGVIITPVEIPTEALVGNPEVSVGLAFILPEEIATQEFVGEPDIDLILKQIFPDAIASLLSVGRPLVLGGDRIIIPIESRVTWNAVAKYLRELVFTGADNDVIMKWLRSEGFDDAYNDNWEQYLKSAGFLSGAMSDKYALWRRGINGVDPWILSDGTWDDSKIWQDLETWRDS